MSSDDATPTTPDAVPGRGDRRSRRGLRARLASRRRWQERNRKERGVVVIWVTLMLVALIGMCGFAVDLSNWWLQSERIQRGADAGAHAGVVFLPGDLPSAASTARAETAKNGYRSTGGNQNATVTVAQEPNPNRLRVRVTTEVPTYFVRVFGINSVELTREAVAEYVAPVPMGSPQNKLGNDPDGVDPGTELWLNAAGPQTGKQQGERYGTKLCNSTQPTREYGCTSTSSDEFAEDGYFYAIDVKSVGSGPLKIQIYDAPFTNQASNCTNMPTITPALTARYPDAATVYASNPDRCPGDQAWGAANVETTYSVARPDTTPWSDADNPLVTSCSPQTAKAYRPPHSPTTTNNSQRTANSNYLTNLLLSATDGLPNASDGLINMAEGYRRWFTICEIPAGQVEVGQYIVRVRTSVRSSAPTTYNAAVDTEGHNRFSIRAGFGDAGLNAVDGSRLSLFARGRLPIFANAQGADTRFYLARILPYDAGRTLRINLYDMGESNLAGTLRVLAPAEYDGTFSGCSISRNDGGSLNVTSSLCQLNNVYSTSGNNYAYNGRVLTIDVPIPEDYECDEDSETGCWVKIQMQYPSSANVTDATTWSATILGNPIRLVE